MFAVAVFNISQLCGRRFASALRFADVRRCRTLYSHRSLTLSALFQCPAADDKDCSEVSERRRPTRWLRQNKNKSRFKRHLPPVAAQNKSPSSSVLVDMILSRDGDNADLHDASLNTARTEIDEKLQEMEEIANIQIRDIHLAMEMEDPSAKEENQETTEVCLCCIILDVYCVHINYAPGEYHLPTVFNCSTYMSST